MGSLTISCCMIVKNEEAFLGRCLRSIAPYVDEIIIVDTGSQDRTVEIAREFTDRIYFHPWENDFSKHRNQSISYASGDWILQIDADEELAPGGGDAIRKAIKEVTPEVNFLMINITDIDQQGRPRATWNFPRVFRNRVGIHYEGIVHNQIIGKGVAVPCAATIWHYGYYLDEKKMEEKRKRSIPLLLKQLRENPENAFALYNLANIYFGAKSYDKAIENAEKALQILKNKEIVSSAYMSLYAILIPSLIEQGRLLDAKKHAEDSISIQPDYLDGYYLLNEVAFLMGDWDLVKETGIRALELYKKMENFLCRGAVVWFYAHSKCHLALRTGAALIKIGELKKGVELFDIGLKDHPSRDAALRFVLKTLEESQLKDLYLRFLDIALNEFPGDAFFNKLKLKALMDACAPDHLVTQTIDRLKEVDPPKNWEFMRALFLLNKGKFREAESALSAILERKGPNRALILAFRALIKEKMGDRDGSLADHRLAVALDPGFGPSWMKLGEFSMLERKWRAAWESLNKARAAGISGPEVDLRISILGIRLGDVTLSLEPLNRLLSDLGLDNHRTIESVEDLASLFEEIGNVLDEQGKARLAAEAYGMAGELDPRKAKLALLAGKRFISLGDPAWASFQLEAALRAAPGDEELLKGIEEVLRGAGIG